MLDVNWAASCNQATAAAGGGAGGDGAGATLIHAVLARYRYIVPHVLHLVPFCMFQVWSGFMLVASGTNTLVEAVAQKVGVKVARLRA